ncbi:hypothetical protein APP_30110 [Aeribacillus pallidus]|nr:hypothetical protein APP_30110 [Aeribacillus pallidus]
MATNESLKEQLVKRNVRKPAANGNGEPITLKALLASPKVKKRFEEVLDKRAPQFMTSIINLYSNDSGLQKCDPMTVISSAMVAASLDLPIDKNLGYAWIVPYYDRKTKSYRAQFQLGYKGYIQLALRTSQYRAINVIEVYEGQLKRWNPLTEELELDFEAKESDNVVGYAGFFELINGFRKTVYWTREQIEAHRKKYSKSDFGWKNDFDAMAKKTVLKSLLSKWGILSIEMQNAFNEDEKEVDTKEMKDITSEVQEVEYIEAEAFEIPMDEELPAEGNAQSFEQESFDIE